MEINKQLFEDVLSGKLKGTFVLRFNGKVNSSNLMRNNYPNNDKYPYRLLINGVRTNYTENGNMLHHNTMTDVDIVDFIPDTNMKENELTIEIPDGKIVDWDESKKQNKIVLKDKQLTYEEICKKLFKDECFYINSTGGIDENPMYDDTPNHATTEHQLECILAKNKLANVAKYLNNGWKPSKTDSGHFDAWVLYVTPNKNYMGCVKIVDCAHNSNVLFKSFELGQQAIEILGEKTIKLALEPLGI